MEKLVLTAKVAERISYHTLIDVFADGGKVGTLYVETRREPEVLGAINNSSELLETLKSVQEYFQKMGPPLGESQMTHEERMLRASVTTVINAVEGKPPAGDDG